MNVWRFMPALVRNTLGDSVVDSTAIEAEPHTSRLPRHGCGQHAEHSVFHDRGKTVKRAITSKLSSRRLDR